MRIPIEQQIKDISRIKEEVNVKQNGKVLYVTVSGSDLYGFPSPDSDIDYRGTYLTGSFNLLGLKRFRDVIEIDPDIVMFEVGKEIGLALAGNCNVLEHINSIPIYRTAEYLQLKILLNNTIGKRGLYNSYRGLATFNYKKFILQGKKSFKKYLYVFRGLMAGIHVMETGKIQPNIEELNRYFKIKEVSELIIMKKNGTEEAGAEELKESGKLDSLIPPLYERLDRTYLKSEMPEKPDEQDINFLNHWLIELRVDNLK